MKRIANWPIARVDLSRQGNMPCSVVRAAASAGARLGYSISRATLTQTQSRKGGNFSARRSSSRGREAGSWNGHQRFCWRRSNQSELCFVQYSRERTSFRCRTYFSRKNCSCTLEEFLVVLSPRTFLLPLDNLFFPPPLPPPPALRGGRGLLGCYPGWRTNRAREVWLGNPFDFHGAAEPLCEVLVSRFPKNMSLI